MRRGAIAPQGGGEGGQDLVYGSQRLAEVIAQSIPNQQPCAFPEGARRVRPSRSVSSPRDRSYARGRFYHRFSIVAGFFPKPSRTCPLDESADKRTIVPIGTFLDRGPALTTRPAPLPLFSRRWLAEHPKSLFLFDEENTFSESSAEASPEHVV